VVSPAGFEPAFYAATTFSPLLANSYGVESSRKMGRTKTRRVYSTRAGMRCLVRGLHGSSGVANLAASARGVIFVRVGSL
jgi:hypothetical protein